MVLIPNPIARMMFATSEIMLFQFGEISSEPVINVTKMYITIFDAVSFKPSLVMYSLSERGFRSFACAFIAIIYSSYISLIVLCPRLIPSLRKNERITTPIMTVIKSCPTQNSQATSVSGALKDNCPSSIVKRLNKTCTKTISAIEIKFKFSFNLSNLFGVGDILSLFL